MVVLVVNRIVDELCDVIYGSFPNVARRLTRVAKHVDCVDVIEFGE